MFTVKAYRGIKTSIYEVRSVDVLQDPEGDTLVLMNQDDGEQPFIRVSDGDSVPVSADGEVEDTPAEMVVIENALGKTTELLRP